MWRGGMVGQRSSGDTSIVHRRKAPSLQRDERRPSHNQTTRSKYQQPAKSFSPPVIAKHTKTNQIVSRPKPQPTKPVHSRTKPPTKPVPNQQTTNQTNQCTTNQTTHTQQLNHQPPACGPRHTTHQTTEQVHEASVQQRAAIHPSIHPTAVSQSVS